MYMQDTSLVLALTGYPTTQQESNGAMTGFDAKKLQTIRPIYLPKTGAYNSHNPE